MRFALLVLTLTSVTVACTHAEVRRALLVGINAYQLTNIEEVAKPSRAAIEAKARKGRGTWTNLDGCINDVEAMREVLIARFGFKPENIRVLENSAATRERIFSSFREGLMDPAAAGDVSFFFYAGHGSEIRNLKATKLSG